jgi:hypothetical protein
MAGNAGPSTRCSQDDKDYVMNRVLGTLANLLLFCQSGDSWEGFAFKEFEAGSSAGGDVGDAVGVAGLLDGGDRVSSSDDRSCIAVARYGCGDLIGAASEGRHLEDAHGAVPDDGAGFGDRFFEGRDRLRADVEGHHVGGEGAVAGEELGLCVGRELVREDVVERKQKTDALGPGFVERGLRDVDLVGLDQRFAGGLTLGVEEGVGHASADDDGVCFVEEVVDDLDLVGYLCASDDGDERLVRFGEGLPEVGQLFLHQQSGGGLLDVVRDALGGGVGAVGAAEGVVDVDVAERGELLREDGIVGLLFSVKAKIFKQERLARLKIESHLAGNGTDTVWRERYVFVIAEDVIEHGAEMIDERAKTHRGDGFAFGAAEMRTEDDLRLVAQGVLDGREGFADASVVGDDAVFERHVEVDADENALVGEVEVADR